MKKKVALIFGGRSAEHEVSVRSAKNVTDALDLKQFEPVLIGISREGTWYKFASKEIFNSIKSLSDKNLPAGAEAASLICNKGKPYLFTLDTQKTEAVDVAFPVMHGTFGEDGCIQGLFKMMNLPFVGCGVLGSAVGMDKEVMKRILKVAGIPNAKYMVLMSHQKNSFDDIKNTLGAPFFIKPANAGSSVGVHKIKTKEDFETKLKDAFLYDHKVLAEEMVVGREIECSVMGHNHAPQASVAGEVIPTHEFYSYEAKYIDDNGAALKIPAELSPAELKLVQDTAKKTFTAMNCDGLTRVDFFLKKDGQAYINEINTIPGFTKISMYPKMWEASGLNYSELITKLIGLALEKHQSDESLMTNYEAL